jgi:hypothetical protein
VKGEPLKFRTQAMETALGPTKAATATVNTTPRLPLAKSASELQREPFKAGLVLKALTPVVFAYHVRGVESHSACNYRESFHNNFDTYYQFL